MGLGRVVDGGLPGFYPSVSWTLQGRFMGFLSDLTPLNLAALGPEP
jgi:hypothetical protein